MSSKASKHGGPRSRQATPTCHEEKSWPIRGRSLESQARERRREDESVDRRLKRRHMFRRHRAAVEQADYKPITVGIRKRTRYDLRPTWPRLWRPCPQPDADVQRMKEPQLRRPLLRYELGTPFHAASELMPIMGNLPQAGRVQVLNPRCPLILKTHHPSLACKPSLPGWESTSQRFCRAFHKRLS